MSAELIKKLRKTGRLEELKFIYRLLNTIHYQQDVINRNEKKLRKLQKEKKEVETVLENSQNWFRNRLNKYET